MLPSLSPLWGLFGALSLGLVLLECRFSGAAPRGANPGDVDLGAGDGSPRRDLAMYGCVVASVALFGAAVWRRAGPQAALAFASGWVLEQALSIDNLFVFLLIFRSLQVPAALQARALRWGLVGAVVLRGAFIVVGLSLVRRLEGVFFLFGGVLVLSAIKVLVDFLRPAPAVREPGGAIALLRRWLPMTRGHHGEAFWVRDDGGLRATPLFAALVAIEVGDVIFAVDSVPAVLSVTQDPLLVASSNLFAILGLRTLYRLLGQAAGRLHYLELGLSAILLFVGGKMLLHRQVEVGTGASLGVVVALFAAAVAASLWRERRRLACSRPNDGV